MTLYERYLWTRESTARTLVGLFVLASFFIAGYGITHAALSTTYEVTNEVQMNLDASITGTQTTGIILSSPQINGINHRFATTTGGLLRIRSGNFREDITYTSATIGSDNRVTLVGVTRNICAQYGRQYISCGDGRRWGKGAIVELAYDARLINLKANLDRANIFTSSGATAYSGSGSLAWPTFATTAARDQQLGATPGGPVRTACVTATGLCYMYIGGAWTAFGNTGVAAATILATGTAEWGTVADASGATIFGDSGAPVFVGTNIVIRGSTGALNNRNKIVATGNNGRLSGSLMGTGTPSSTTILYGDQRWGVISASGVNVFTRDITSSATLTDTAVYQQIDKSLSGSIVTSVGTRVQMAVTFPYIRRISATGTGPRINFKIGNGFATNNGSGALTLWNDSAGAGDWWRLGGTLERTVTSQTGGTLVVFPVVDWSGSAGDFKFDYPVHFEVTLIK